MNIAKNMETIFVVAIALVSATSFATASNKSPASRVASASVAVEKMQVVTISTKRMSAAEKAVAAQ